MKLYTNIFLLLMLFVCSQQVAAQSTDALISKANKKYKELDFQGAIELYEQALKKETKPAALFKLPECYRRVGNYIKAENWYAQAAQHPEAPTEIFFYLGLCQLSNDKLEDASANFKKFKELESAQLRAHNMIHATNEELRKEFMNAGGLYDIVYLPQLNTKYDDFGANFFGTGLIFSTDRDTSKITAYRGSWLLKPYVQSYFVEANL